MTLPLREQFQNNAATTVAEEVDGSETEIDVTDGSVFPSVGNFRLICEDEIMLCTSRASDTLTVVRGSEGTSAAAHTTSTPITLIMTEGGMDRWCRDNDPLWNQDAGRPAFKIESSTGSNLAATDFTIDNGANATVADQAGTITMDKQDNSNSVNCTMAYRSSGSAPYEYIAAFQYLAPISQPQGTAVFGFGFRENSTGKIMGVNLVLSGDAMAKIGVFKYTDSTDFGGAYVDAYPLHMAAPHVWLKLEDDNTDLNFFVSMDGVNWYLVGTEARTSFMSGGPDQVGFYADNRENGNSFLVRLCHWSGPHT